MCATLASPSLPCPARTDSLAAALLQFPSGSTTSTTSVTVLPTQGLPYTHTHTRTYASCCLCVCVCVSHFESLIEIINSKTNGFLLQFRSTKRETDARTKDLCQFFLSFFFLLACRMYFQAAVVVVADGLLSRLQQVAVAVVFVLSCCHRSTLCLS